MKQLFDEHSLSKQAQGFSEGDLLAKVKSFAKYDPENPVESILAFLGPGVLWMLGFRWFAVLYSLAEALGFNWEHIFVSIKEALRPLLHDVVASKSLQDPARVQQAVQAGLQSGTEETVNPSKIPALMDKLQAQSSTNNLFLMKKIGARYSNRDLSNMLEGLTHSMTGNRLRRGLTGFFVRVFTWLILAVLVAAGFAVAGHTVSSLLGTNKQTAPGEAPPDGNAPADKAIPASSMTDTSRVKLHLNPSPNSTYLAIHDNSKGNVWLLPININQLHDNLIQWAQNLYPQLTDNSAFQASTAFQDTLKMFHDRNQTAQDMKFIAVPPPFTSIKDIVDSFAADVATKMDTSSSA